MEYSRQLAEMLQADPPMPDVHGSAMPEQKNLLRIRGGSDGESKVSAIRSVAANVHAADEVKTRRMQLICSIKAPGSSPVRSGIFTNPVFESGRGQSLLQRRHRHIFDPGNQVGSL